MAFLCCGLQREGDDEAGSLARFGMDLYRPAVLVDDALGGGQAQPAAVFLCGEIDLEDLSEVVGGNARTGVDDFQHGLLAVGRELHEQLPALAHGLDGVDHQVEDGLLEKVGIDIARNGVVGGGGSQDHAGGLGLGGEEVRQLSHQVAEVDDGGLEFVFSGVTEKVLQDALEPSGLGLDAVEAHQPAAVEGVVVPLEVLGQQLEIDVDRREGVLDFMG